MDQVLIKDLLVRGIIGVNPDERKNRQDILINVILYTDTSRAALSDRLEDCVDYRAATKKVMAFTESAQRFTVEALANDIAGLCLKEANVLGVRVRVEKPGAARFAKSVGVEIERFPQT